MKKIMLLSLILIPVFSFIAHAQIMKSQFYRNADLKSGFSYQSWSTENDQTVSEFVIPVNFIIPVNNQLTLNVSTSSAFASMNKAASSLNGITDTRISGSYVTMDNKLLLTAGIFLPTGKTTLEDDQAIVASALSLYPLNFRVPSFGQGLMLNATALTAFEVENFIIGGGVAFLYKNGFKPYEGNDAKYKPGMEFSLNAGGETNYSSKFKLLLDVTYTFYGSDTYDQTEVFKSGNKLIADLRANFYFRSVKLLLYARERTKGRNERGVGSLNTEERNSNGNQLDFGSLAYFPISEKYTLKTLLDLKMYSKNEYENNGASIFGIGAGFNFLFSEIMSFDLLAKYSTGSLKNQDLSVGVTGIELSGGIKLSF